MSSLDSSALFPIATIHFNKHNVSIDLGDSVRQSDSFRDETSVSVPVGDKLRSSSLHGLRFQSWKCAAQHFRFGGRVHGAYGAHGGHGTQRFLGFGSPKTQSGLSSPQYQDRSAGTHADENHVQTADDAADEANRVFNRKHHSYSGKSLTAKTQTFMGKVAACLSSSRFESGLSIVICLNMILIIAETDLTADGQAPPTWITTANISFLIVYFVECIFKITVFRWAYFQDWSLCWKQLLRAVLSSGKVDKGCKRATCFCNRRASTKQQ